MFDESPKRFDRIVAILIQLQSKKIVKAQELADRFEVSLRTIYRDIRSLEASGVPIYSEAGIGYSLIDGYRLPPVMFTREEASSFIAAEKLMQQFTDKELGEHYESAMFKLKSVLRSEEKDMVSEIESKVLIRNPKEIHGHIAPNAMATVFRSIGEKLQLNLFYEAISADEPSHRIIEPVGIFHENGNWYVYGYCHLRQDYRQFRTDRIHKITLGEQKFSKSHDALETYLDSPGHETTLIRILVGKDVAKYIKDDRRSFGFSSQKETAQGIEMTFLSRNPKNGFARWFMMYADLATILEPDWIKERIAELLESAKARL
ncbi:YafY family transcriptional regulator [Flavobacterium sp. SE-s28]|uniref:YafY family transcriptional regulator n=2 Tax=Flavobacterium silvaticum TaxID=1852020 RepID=A0A972JIY7_9FLAO|nr:YafY family transcriptional regulator [Flavobacterium silvaticum]